MSEAKKDVIEAALTLAGEEAWANISLADIAEKAGLSLDELYIHVETKDDILRGFGEMIDAQVRESFEGQSLEGDEVRDRLFDVLMERFDLLNDYRAGVLSIMKSYQCDPKQAAISLPYLAKSMAFMLELAEVETQGMRGAFKILGLMGLYLDTAFRVWSKDDTPDMSKTMAALDTKLGRAETIVNSLAL